MDRKMRACKSKARSRILEGENGIAIVRSIDLVTYGVTESVASRSPVFLRWSSVD